MTRKVLVLAVLVFAAAIGACIPQALHRLVLLAETINAPGGPLRAVTRLRQIEKLGRVPDNADIWDWWLAQKSSWWGKPLDPKAFWNGRTLWLDESATMATRRRGRLYPPIPYEASRFASRSGEDQSTMPSADSTGVTYRLNDKENAFWDSFARNHPQPPEYILSQQGVAAWRILGVHYRFEHDTGSSFLTQAGLEAIDAGQRREARALGFPPEAFTDDALRWKYVLDKRAEYEQQYVRTHRQDTVSASNYLAQLFVDPRLVIQPLSSEQVRAANAWKIAYLRRLRGEHTDESYIRAYLSVWKLTTGEVFVTSNDL